MFLFQIIDLWKKFLITFFVLSGMIGCQKGEQLVTDLKQTLNNFKKTYVNPPRVYFEEWDEPMISGIEWVSDMIEWCGGTDVFRDRSKGKLAKERFVKQSEVAERDPDIILGAGVGKS